MALGGNMLKPINSKKWLHIRIGGDTESVWTCLCNVLWAMQDDQEVFSLTVGQTIVCVLPVLIGLREDVSQIVV